MFVFGHVGLTVGAARAVDPGLDLRLPMALCVLPDLIDKPAVLLLASIVNGSTRNFGHTLVGAAAVFAVLVAGRRRWGNPLLLWACYAGHFLLDRLWQKDNPIIFLWPFLGPFPRPVPGTFIADRLEIFNLAGEALGLIILLRLAWRHRGMGGTWKEFLRTGRLLERDAR